MFNQPVKIKEQFKHKIANFNYSGTISFSVLKKDQSDTSNIKPVSRTFLINGKKCKRIVREGILKILKREEKSSQSKKQPEGADFTAFRLKFLFIVIWIILICCLINFLHKIAQVNIRIGTVPVYYSPL